MRTASPRRTSTCARRPCSACCPASCLAIEDSVNGVLSARAAGMPCVAVPDEVTAADPRLGAATLRLDSLGDLDDERLEELRRAYFA